MAKVLRRANILARGMGLRRLRQFWRRSSCEAAIKPVFAYSDQRLIACNDYFRVNARAQFQNAIVGLIHDRQSS